MKEQTGINEGELSIIDDGGFAVIDTDMFVGLTGTTGTKFFTSMPHSTEEESVDLFNACTSNDDRLKAHIGKKLNIVHVLCQEVSVKNMETGEPGRAPRIVLIDDKGKSYGCVSIGILSALERATGIFGPAPWNPPIVIEPVLVSTRENRSVLSIKMHTRSK